MPPIHTLTDDELCATLHLAPDELHQLISTTAAARREADYADMWTNARRFHVKVCTFIRHLPLFFWHLVQTIFSKIWHLLFLAWRFKALLVVVLLCIATLLGWTVYPEVEARVCRSQLVARLSRFRGMAWGRDPCSEHSEFERRRREDQIARDMAIQQARQSYNKVAHLDANITGILDLSNRMYEQYETLHGVLTASSGQLYQGGALTMQWEVTFQGFEDQNEHLSNFVPALKTYQQCASYDAKHLQTRIDEYNSWAKSAPNTDWLLRVIAQRWPSLQASLTRPRLESEAHNYFSRLLYNADHLHVETKELLKQAKHRKRELETLVATIDSSQEGYIATCHDYNQYRRLRCSNPTDWPLLIIYAYSPPDTNSSTTELCRFTTPQRYREHVEALLNDVQHIEVKGAVLRDKLSTIRNGLLSLMKTSEQQLHKREQVPTLPPAAARKGEKHKEEEEEEEVHDTRKWKLPLDHNIQPATLLTADLDKLLEDVIGPVDIPRIEKEDRIKQILE